MILHGDCAEVMASLPECSVDAVVCDPPYGLAFMGRAWDTVTQTWHQQWATEALRVLKPGGHLVAFGGTRTYHRLACAVEDAGFEIRDSLAWLYGQGFPKSRNIGDGWGTALKPAMEPIVLARKPLSERTVAANVLRWGTGAINVDGCRVATDEVITNHARSSVSAVSKGIYGDSGSQATHQTAGQAAGRWPANVILDPEAAVLLDEQSGERGGGFGVRGRGGNVYGGGDGYTTEMGVTGQTVGFGDSGGASRFFYCAKASTAERSRGLADRNGHPTVKPVALMRWLVRLVTPAGGTVLDPFLGSGTTALAAIAEGMEWIGIEREAEYVAIAEQRISAISEAQMALELGG